MTTATAVAVDIPIREDHGGGHVTVEGIAVAPGLALAPAIGEGRVEVPGRYVLVQIPSGRALTRRYLCRAHADLAALLARLSPVDWPASVDAPAGDPELGAVRRAVVDLWRPSCCAGPLRVAGAR